LAHKLGEEPAREIPTRPLPFGSENVHSPTYVAQALASGTHSGSTPRTTIPEPSYHGPEALWEKDENYLSHLTPEPATEEEADVLDT
jgi:glycogenin